MPSIKFDFPKLKGEKNYSTWSIRGKAHLICAGYIKSLDDIIEQVNPPDPPEGSSVSLSSNGTPTPVFHAKAPEEDRVDKDQKGLATLKLIVEDGPLSHIKRAKTLGEAWLILKNQYDKEGFSAIFVVIKKFIMIKYSKTKVGPFLNEIRTLVNDLEAKGVNLPETFVNAWVLERLDKSYDDFKTSIYSTLRDNANTYTLEQLSSHIMDESRRRQSMSDSSEERREALLSLPIRGSGKTSRLKVDGVINVKYPLTTLTSVGYFIPISAQPRRLESRRSTILRMPIVRKLKRLPMIAPQKLLNRRRKSLRKKQWWLFQPDRAVMVAL